MKNAISKGIIGVIGPTTGYVISISTVEIWLRVLSLVIGILVGLLSAISICLSIRRKIRQQRREQRLHDEETTTV